MSNADMPAMPLPNNVHRDLLESLAHGCIDPVGSGLTKREDFAKTALQGLLAFYGDDQEWDVTAREAVACADALLRELEATK